MGCFPDPVLHAATPVAPPTDAVIPDNFSPDRRQLYINVHIICGQFVTRPFVFTHIGGSTSIFDFFVPFRPTSLAPSRSLNRCFRLVRRGEATQLFPNNADSWRVNSSSSPVITPTVARNSDRFIARQPIFDGRENVFAYELLFRSGLENRYTADDPEAAVLDVVDYFLSAGPRTLTAGRRAFINCTRQFLVEGYATLLPKQEAVIEILETVEPDAEVVTASRELKERGYLIALDDFVYAEKFQPLVELADIIKIDFKLSSPSERLEAVAMFVPRGIQLLAEKVETRAEFAEAYASGYNYFQGYFFCQPQIVPARQIPAFKLHYLRLLLAINKPDLDRREICALISREPSLCYKLLRLVNSPLFGYLREVTSTCHAMTLLGERELRKWASVAAVLGAAGDKPSELVLTSLTRGRCCELLAQNPAAHLDQQSMFLLGIFSLMEAMLGRPMAEIVTEVALPEAVRSALVGKANGYREFLELVKAIEAGNWSHVSTLCSDLRQDERQLSAAYLEAVDWAQKVFKVKPDA